jgi:hypothetical protein
MPDAPRNPFSYAIIRVVPRVERGERFNVGVVLFCRQREFLAVKVSLDENRLRALAPGLRPDELRSHLAALVMVVDGDADGGPVSALSQSDRFGWLVAPSSTVLQPSAVHTGLSADPQRTLDELFAELVEPVTA